jgi:hypothetical protein
MNERTERAVPMPLQLGTCTRVESIQVKVPWSTVPGISIEQLHPKPPEGQKQSEPPAR